MNILIDRVGAGLKNQDPRLLAMTLPVFRDAYPDIIYRSGVWFAGALSASTRILFYRRSCSLEVFSTNTGECCGVDFFM